MATEASMPTESAGGPQDGAEPASAGSGFVPTSAGRFEEVIIRTLCEPVLVRLPSSLKPNTISLVTHVIAWATAALAIGSVQLPAKWKSAALVGAGVGTLLQMIGDCLDGMHARRTGQCSKLGEMMDHWLDANVVPLSTLGITLALGMDPWALVLVNATATMVYQAQLTLYHDTGDFLVPDTTSGVEAQFGLSLGYCAVAALFFFVDRDALWLDISLAVVAVIGVYVQMRCNWFYYRKLGKHVTGHLMFAGYLFAFGGLYLWGAMDLAGFVVTLIFTSFRVSGSYVLRTLLKHPYDGVDVGLILAPLAIAGVYMWLPNMAIAGTPLLSALPWLAGSYLLIRNLMDFRFHYRELA